MDALWGSLDCKLLVSHNPPDMGFADLLMNAFWPAITATARPVTREPDTAAGLQPDRRILR